MTNRVEGYPFRFAGEQMIARASGALWWPARRMLVVADLHLGRSERYARRGGALLPPFEVTDTLDRLEREFTALGPARVVSLGDTFDDDLAATQITSGALHQIARMAVGRDWLWITGNHDRCSVPRTFPGQSARDLPGAITLRHQAACGPDISGHMHPSTRLAGRTWRCFVLAQDHLILPAFGTFTGGLDIGDAAFDRLAPDSIALICSDRVFASPVRRGRKAGTTPATARLKLAGRRDAHGQVKVRDPQGRS